jgi:hypothetical protein
VSVCGPPELLPSILTAEPERMACPLVIFSPASPLSWM